jgi:hypothetical protein
MLRRIINVALIAIGAISLTGFEAVAGPAPPLRYLQVHWARSEKCPQYERFSANQGSSIKDHGGRWMYIVTDEHGYPDPYSRYAEMNGKKLSLLRMDAIHLDADRIVDGWRCYWNASGQQSGVFKYRAKSINYPWNTLYDSIYIK